MSTILASEVAEKLRRSSSKMDKFVWTGLQIKTIHFLGQSEQVLKKDYQRLFKQFVSQKLCPIFHSNNWQFLSYLQFIWTQYTIDLKKSFPLVTFWFVTTFSTNFLLTFLIFQQSWEGVRSIGSVIPDRNSCFVLFCYYFDFCSNTISTCPIFQFRSHSSGKFFQSFAQKMCHLNVPRLWLLTLTKTAKTFQTSGPVPIVQWVWKKHNLMKEKSAKDN